MTLPPDQVLCISLSLSLALVLSFPAAHPPGQVSSSLVPHSEV